MSDLEAGAEVDEVRRLLLVETAGAKQLATLYVQALNMNQAVVEASVAFLRVSGHFDPNCEQTDGALPAICTPRCEALRVALLGAAPKIPGWNPREHVGLTRRLAEQLFSVVKFIEERRPRCTTCAGAPTGYACSTCVMAAFRRAGGA